MIVKQKKVLRKIDYFKELIHLSQQKNKNLISEEIDDLFPIINQEKKLISQIIEEKEIESFKEKERLRLVAFELQKINQRNKELVMRSLSFLGELFRYISSFGDKNTYGSKSLPKPLLFNQII